MSLLDQSVQQMGVIGGGIEQAGQLENERQMANRQLEQQRLGAIGEIAGSVMGAAGGFAASSMATKKADKRGSDQAADAQVSDLNQTTAWDPNVAQINQLAVSTWGPKARLFGGNR